MAPPGCPLRPGGLYERKPRSHLAQGLLAAAWTGPFWPLGLAVEELEAMVATAIRSEEVSPTTPPLPPPPLPGGGLGGAGLGEGDGGGGPVAEG